MHVFIKGNKPFYARLVYRDASANQLQILPNNFRPENSFQGGAIYSVPDGADGFELETSAPFGHEEIAVFASTAPLGSIQRQDIGGIYLLEESREKLARATRGVKIKKSAPSHHSPKVSNQSPSTIIEFFEGHTQIITSER